MAQRGEQSDRMDALKGVIARNDIRLEMKQLDGELRALEDESRKPAPENPLDWTERAGMTAQQGSALRAFQTRGGGLFPPVAPLGAGARPTPPTRKPEPTAPTPADKQAETTDAKAERLAKLQELFTRKAEDNNSPDPDNSHSPGRGGRGGRGRTR
jgi:hypothetical protein